MDPMDDFEFKPLSEGLGFHKRNKTGLNKDVNFAMQSSSADFTTATPNKNYKTASMQPNQSKSDIMMPTLPRKTTSPAVNTPLKKEAPQTNNAVDEILKTLKSRNLDFENNKKTLKEIKNPKIIQPEFKEATAHFSSAILDAMLVTASTLMCLIILLFVTKVDLFKIVFNPDNQGMVYLSLFSIFAGVNFIYMVVNRVFAGFTPGEWAFDLRIGKPTEQEQGTYILRVMARTLLTMVTGFILLPIISAIIKTDIAGFLTGAQLYKKA